MWVSDVWSTPDYFRTSRPWIFLCADFLMAVICSEKDKWASSVTPRSFAFVTDSTRFWLFSMLYTAALRLLITRGGKLNYFIWENIFFSDKITALATDIFKLNCFFSIPFHIQINIQLHGPKWNTAKQSKPSSDTTFSLTLALLSFLYRGIDMTCV